MKLVDRLGIEYSHRDIFRRYTIPVTGAVFLLACLVGRGTNPDSDIATRGKQVQSPLYSSKMYKSELEKEAEEFGLYVNKKLYGPGVTGLYTYEGKPPKYLDLEFMLSAGKTIIDIMMEVNGRRLDVAHTQSKEKIVGHSRFSDHTGGGEGKYDVRFTVTYQGGKKKEIFVKVRKEDEQKTN